MIVRRPKSVVLGDGNKRAEQELLGLADKTEKVFSVSTFLDLVNTGLSTFRAKIRGEVTSATERNGHWYFDLKDREGGSVISCLIWRNNYRLSGVAIEAGQEIIALGVPAVYKPSGRLSFQAETIELSGEGALGKQFEALKKKMAAEGLFAPERKRPVPVFPEKIGLITSKQGEAIHDFLTNLGRFGLKISFADARVEGTQAVPSLIAAIRKFKSSDIDVLVLIRGGGSLESLLSFNNEALAREIAAFGKPVVTGVGHEQDVSLADLVADRSCSTPTGAARLLSYGWEQARARVDLAERQILSSFRDFSHQEERRISESGTLLREYYRRLLGRFDRMGIRLHEEFRRLFVARRSASGRVDEWSGQMKNIRPRLSPVLAERIAAYERALSGADPRRPLRLGYALARRGGSLLRSVEEIAPDEAFELQLQDGEVLSIAKRIKKNER